MNGRFRRPRPMNERERGRVHERVFMNGRFRRPRPMNEHEHERVHERGVHERVVSPAATDERT
eukprot:4502635-Prymnesium_polylepis.2